MLAGSVYAQRGTGDWMTAGFDAQRTNWVRSDNKISPASMAKPGFKLVWKMKFDNEARQLNSVNAPSLMDFYIGYRGFRTLAFFSGSADRVIAVDTDLARLEWQNKYTTPADAQGTPGCPGGITASVTRPTHTAYPPPSFGRGFGRGTPAKSGVGEPHQGSVVLAALASRREFAPRPQPVKPSRGTAAPPENPFAPHVQYAMVLSSDGKLHLLWVSNGNEPDPGIPFVPPDANATGLISYDSSVYVATTGSCGAAGNGVWAMDLGTHKVNHWKASSEVAGTAGPAIGPDGKLYVAAGHDLVALSPKKLETLAIYKSPDASFTSTPVIFNYKDKDLIAVTTDDGRLHLLDTSSLNTEQPLARSDAFSSTAYAAGALASWQDAAGTRWILAPAGGEAADKAGFKAAGGELKNGAIVAWKVVDKDGKPALERGWVSRDMTSPLPPIVVNGVVFAVSSGEYRTNDPNVSVSERVQKSGKAVLYALDGLSGKELWNSGDTITSFVHSGALAAGGTRVYVASYDGTQYAFGFPIEH